MRLTLTTNEGVVLDWTDVTADEWRAETARHPHGLAASLDPGETALAEDRV
jgi:hypothetical protein